jgi:serine/threonine protein kinase
LLQPQATAGVGNPRYLAPEIVKGEVFDGHAVDLWAAGVMLCGMLFGTEAPFVWASPDDRRFKEICVKGNLQGISLKWEVDHPHKRAKAEPVSDDALNLIQNMLWADPQERLTLEAVMEHPWVTAQSEAPLMPASAQKMG